MSAQNRPWQESPQGAAIYYSNIGLEIFPCSAAKVPLINAWQKAATTNLEIIVSWWRQFPFADVAWSLPASVAVIDVDVKHGKHGFRDFEALTGVGTDKFPTPSASSPSGGVHLFCSTGGKKYLNAVPIAGTGVDLKTRVGFVVLPGAGNGRRWIPGRPNKPAPIRRRSSPI